MGRVDSFCLHGRQYGQRCLNHLETDGIYRKLANLKKFNHSVQIAQRVQVLDASNQKFVCVDKKF